MITKMLELSTAHLKKETCNNLLSIESIVAFRKDRYGYLSISTLEH